MAAKMPMGKSGRTFHNTRTVQSTISKALRAGHIFKPDSILISSKDQRLYQTSSDPDYLLVQAGLCILYADY